jgi:hypothetical protein
MKCLKCGHNNDLDARFCEKCGSTLKSTASNLGNSNNGMKTFTKVLIVAIIILVAGLGVTSGMLLQKNNGAAAANNTTGNQLNTSTNSSTDNTNSIQTSNRTSSSSSGFISVQQAIDIAKSSIESDPSNVYSAQFIDGLPYNSPYYYIVSAKYDGSNGLCEEPTEVDVNAKTGQIITTFQAGGNDPLEPD